MTVSNDSWQLVVKNHHHLPFYESYSGQRLKANSTTTIRLPNAKAFEQVKLNISHIAEFKDLEIISESEPCKKII